MKTILFGTTEQDIQQAADIIAKGGLVAFPTETVYGLGANALDSEAVGKVYAAKGRPSDNPMIVHISTFDDMLKLTDLVTDDIKIFEKNFWPGPLTMVVPAKDIIPKVTTGGLDTVAIRMPSNPVAAELIEKSGVPIAAPSANLSGKPSPTTAAHVVEDLSDRIDGIIMGESCQVGIESTVVDMTADPPVILRPGIITREQLSEACGKEVGIDPALLQKPDIFNNGGLLETGNDFRPKSPGMKYKHYAPKAEMKIYRGEKEAVLSAIEKEKNEQINKGFKVEVIVFNDDNPSEAAHDFFARLRKCDADKVDIILAAALKEDGVGFSVMNRMFKSAGYNIIDL